MQYDLKDEVLGECVVNVGDYSYSIVDAYLQSGYSLTLDRDLTDAELDRLQAEHIDWIANDIYAQGYSRNHN